VRAEALDESGFEPSGKFLTTRWSVVILAGQERSPAATDALEKLCRAYWYPIYAEIRRRGFASHDAEDYTQEFFACLLRRNSFALADKNKGRFRSYLVGALNYFLTDQWLRQRTGKRGGGAPVLSLDAPGDAEERFIAEPASQLTPEKIFDARWALMLMERAFTRIRDEYAASGKAELFEALKPFLAAESGDEGYAKPAHDLGMSASHVAVLVHRLRRRFRDCVCAEVADTVANPADVESEMRELFGVS
jgi:DNA-directed RNA polymerase specialized sigma24 family protein